MDPIIYLDNSATTKVFPEVVEVMKKYMTDFYANPSASYRAAIDIENEIKNCRSIISKNVKSLPEEIYFTSGGTESNNMAILGVVKSNRGRKRHLITTKIEHPSVLEVYKMLEKDGFDVTYLNADSRGNINIDDIKNAIRLDTLLVSIMHVNNEIGAIQDIDNISNIINQQNPQTIFHSDGVQAFGKMPIFMNHNHIDLYTASAHKIHGPKGIGMLYVRKGTPFETMVYGGGQEKGIRSGTENVPGIIGLAYALQVIRENDFRAVKKISILKKELCEGLTEKITEAYVNGPEVYQSAPHILNISFRGIRGEVLVHSLESKGILVSTGAACSSKKKIISHVLTAIGLSDNLASSSIRFSLGAFTTREEINATIEETCKAVMQLRKYRRD